MKLRSIHLLVFGGITLILCAGKIEPEKPTDQEKSSDLAFQCTAPIEIIGEIPVPPPGGVVTVTTFANAINSSGQVVGHQHEKIDNGITITETRKAYVSDDGVTLDFFAPNDSSYARGIDGSIVVGNLDGSNNPLAFYYDLASQDDLVYINEDDGTATYEAYDIHYENPVNDTSTINIVGYGMLFSDGIIKAFMYTSDDDCSFLDAPFVSEARAINNQNIVVGNYSIDTVFNFPHAFVYNHERTPSLIDLGYFSVYAAYESFALDINDQNVVVGATEISVTTELRAFWFDTDVPLHSAQMEIMDCITDTIGTLCPVEALAINNADFIVGSGSYTPEPTSRDEAFLYDKNNDALYNLNDLIDDASWRLEEATDINDSGWIVGNGTRNGQGRAFKLHCSYENANYLPVVLKNFWNAILRR